MLGLVERSNLHGDLRGLEACQSNTFISPLLCKAPLKMSESDEA